MNNIKIAWLPSALVGALVLGWFGLFAGIGASQISVGGKASISGNVTISTVSSGSLALSTLSDAQLTSLTDAQLSSLTN
jgi:hypothetical protein